jgi:hypothetical protein
MTQNAQHHFFFQTTTTTTTMRSPIGDLESGNVVVNAEDEMSMMSTLGSPTTDQRGRDQQNAIHNPSGTYKTSTIKSVKNYFRSRKQKRQSPNSNQESPNSSSGNNLLRQLNNEVTPLLEESQHNNSSDGDNNNHSGRLVTFVSSTAGGSGSMAMAEERQEAIPHPSSSPSQWISLRKRVQDGDLLLMGMGNTQQQSNRQNATTSSTNRDHDTLVQEAYEEIRSGMNFSTAHCVTAILVYFGVSILFYGLVFEREQWSMIDTCYFAVATFTTVGYGDIAPTSQASMIFTCFYALTGVACWGVAFGILGSKLVEAQENAVKRAGELSKYQVLSAFDTNTTTTSTIGSGQQKDQQKGIILQAQQSSGGGGCPWGLVRAIPLLALLLGMAFVIANESGWDGTKTIYYLIITGRLTRCFLPKDLAGIDLPSDC